VDVNAQGIGRACWLERKEQVCVASVVRLGLSALDVVPPVADEVLLVEQGTVGAEERLGSLVGRVAEVESLNYENKCLP
jgi:hypothetical protein